MNTTTILLLFGLVVIAIAAVVCAMIAAAEHRRRSLDLDQLAQRADANGAQLLVIVRSMRDWAAIDTSPARKAQLRRWADLVEQFAIQHLQCINAISIETLQQVTDKPVHLGEFKPTRQDRRRNPGLCRVPEIFLRRRHG